MAATETCTMLSTSSLMKLHLTGTGKAHVPRFQIEEGLARQQGLQGQQEAQSVERVDSTIA